MDVSPSADGAMTDGQNASDAGQAGAVSNAGDASSTVVGDPDKKGDPSAKNPLIIEDESGDNGAGSGSGSGDGSDSGNGSGSGSDQNASKKNDRSDLIELPFVPAE